VGALGQHGLAEVLEEGEFQLQGALAGGGDAGLQVGQLGRRVARGAGHALAAHERGRDLGLVLAGDLDVPADQVVVADLERGDGGLAAVALLQRHDVAAAGVLEGAQLVQFGRDPVAGEAAVAGEEGRLVGEAGGQALAQVRRRGEAGGDVGQGGLGGEAVAELAARSSAWATASRSRGPPRPTARRERARSRSGQRRRAARASSRRPRRSAGPRPRRGGGRSRPGR
jgi:hypothetical protein